MLCPYLLISINELLISIISFNDINKYGLNVKTAAHRYHRLTCDFNVVGIAFQMFGVQQQRIDTHQLHYVPLHHFIQYNHTI